MLNALAVVLKPPPKPFGEWGPAPARGESALGLLLRMTLALLLAVIVATFLAALIDDVLGFERGRLYLRGLPRAFRDELVFMVETALIGALVIPFARLVMRGDMAQLFPYGPWRLDRVTLGLTAAMLGIDTLFQLVLTGTGTTVAQYLHWPRDPGVAPLFIISTVLVAPIAEEIVFRGLIQGAVRSALGVAASIILPTLLFAAVHFEETWTYALFLLPGSFCLAIAREMTGSLTPPIIIHIIGNAVATVMLAGGSGQ